MNCLGFTFLGPKKQADPHIFAIAVKRSPDEMASASDFETIFTQARPM